MGRAVAIETSGRIGSVATAVDGRVLDEQVFPHGLQHAAGLVPLIDRMCTAQGWTPRDIDELYVSSGPGSFTGLRISITLAKTLALATGVKIVAVPTVQVLARNAPDDARNIIIVLDAKRDQIFTARFSRAPGETASTLTEPEHLDRLSAMIERSPKPVHLLGEGIPFHRQHIPSSPDVVVVDEAHWRARASVVVLLGHAMAQRGAFADPLTLTPTYIRKPEAEEKWEASQKK